MPSPAALLLPFVRPVVDGPTPLHLISKPVPGSGATLLTECIGAITCGTWSLQSVPTDEAERRRALLALLREDPGVVILDNVKNLEGAALASCLTSTTYQDRETRTAWNLRVPNRCLWLATGNNPRLSDEIARRTVLIRLDVGEQNPDPRRDFLHPELKKWVPRHRYVLVHSLLTIIQTWIVRGRPENWATLGGFESWARTIGGILDVAGVGGFLHGIKESRAKSDTETVAFGGFVERWASRYGECDVKVGKLLDQAGEIDLGQGNERSREIKLGFLLGEGTGQVFGEWKIEKKAKLSNGYQMWRLTRVEIAVGKGSGGSGCSG